MNKLTIILLVICLIESLMLFEFYGVVSDLSQTSLNYQNKANKCEDKYDEMIYEKQQLKNKIKEYERIYGKIDG